MADDSPALRLTPQDQAVTPGDYYTTDEGLVVFTAEYLRRRGACCHNGCRHCPYPKEENPE